MDLIRTVRKKMMEEHLMFVYRGVVTNDNSVPLLMLLEKEMEHSEFGFQGRKRLFMFVLESLQNVSRHSFGSRHAHMSLVVYSKTPGGYTVSTGNVMHNSGIEDLRQRLEGINKLETGDVRSVYRQMLSSSEFSSKGGAGLGLIEMAKKTGNKLDFDFAPVDDEYSYFILSKTVDHGGIGSHTPADQVSFSGKKITELEKLMADNNLYLIWSGHITPEVGKEVLTFTESGLAAADDVGSALRKRVFSILMETIQNVAKFSPGREPEEKYGMPLAMIKITGKEYKLTTGNLILHSEVEQLKEKLLMINSRDKAGLKELYIKSLKDHSIDSGSTGNLGLIDIARKSGSRLEFDFERINDMYSYYMLNVKVEEEKPDQPAVK